MHKSYVEIYQRWLFPSLLSCSFCLTNLVYIQCRAVAEKGARITFEEQDLTEPVPSEIVADRPITSSPPEAMAVRQPSSAAGHSGVRANSNRQLKKTKPSPSDIQWGTFRPDSVK